MIFKLHESNNRMKKLWEDSLGNLSMDDDPEETEQKYSSAATSINSSKLPALFKMVRFEKGSVNLDYGGGKFDNVAEYLESKYGATNLVYDKYNRTPEHNREVLKLIRQNGGADTVTCSNVLNVIAEESERLAVLRNCKRYLKPGGTCYITVYEGSGMGDGKPTKAGYQLNRRTKDYEDEIRQVFSNVTRKGKLWVCRATGGLTESYEDDFWDIYDKDPMSGEELEHIISRLGLEDKFFQEPSVATDTDYKKVLDAYKVNHPASDSFNTVYMDLSAILIDNGFKENYYTHGEYEHTYFTNGNVAVIILDKQDVEGALRATEY